MRWPIPWRARTPPTLNQHYPFSERREHTPLEQSPFDLLFLRVSHTSMFPQGKKMDPGDKGAVGKEETEMEKHACLVETRVKGAAAPTVRRGRGRARRPFPPTPLLCTHLHPTHATGCSPSSGTVLFAYLFPPSRCGRYGSSLNTPSCVCKKLDYFISPKSIPSSTSCEVGCQGGKASGTIMQHSGS